MHFDLLWKKSLKVGTLCGFFRQRDLMDLLFQVGVGTVCFGFVLFGSVDL